MQVDCITLFPEMFGAVTAHGITRRALDEGRWSLTLWNPRNYASDNYRTIDDRPYGGGPGMVMMAPPLAAALAAAKSQAGRQSAKVICLSPQGRILDHRKVVELASAQSLILVCGRYEGVDERFIARKVDEELSIGDYVLSGGELAAMVLIDAMVRQLPGALGDAQSAIEDSFVGGLLDCPHYTRPEAWEGERVPGVLLSGHHDEIARWRRKQALGRTWQRRPELLARQVLSAGDERLLVEFRAEDEKLREGV